MSGNIKRNLKICGIAIIVILAIVVNTLCCTVFDRPLRTFIGETASVGGNADYTYNKTDLTAATIGKAKTDLSTEIAREGIVLLEYDKDYMPYAKGTKFSLFSHSSVSLAGGGSLKDTFKAVGFEVNEKLWNFYNSGNGSSYRRGRGSIDFGESMDYAVNECPLDVIKSESGLEATFAGTTAVFVFTRICGEGVDPARAMYGGTNVVADYGKSYQEPDSVELEIIDYLNSNFDDVVVIVNNSNPFELGWIKNYANIHNVISIALPGVGLPALAEIMSGKVTPSAKLVDTYAYDVMSSPAAQNSGDFVYYNNGNVTDYNYITYSEGIYVGYKYYETRYEDAVLGNGNVGEYDYDKVVQYPFGYGLSYTDFEWSDFAVSYDAADDQFTVSVTVTNKGLVSGKEVVQVYAQKPYTDYDKVNKIEKSSVDLVGFAKTEDLKAADVNGEGGGSQTIEVKFSGEQLKSFDAYGKGTYILENGDYFFTAAPNAHEAVNNILAEKGVTKEEYPKMTANGNELLAEKFNFTNVEFGSDGVNATIYSTDSVTQTPVKNQLSCGTNDQITYLTRNDWTGTFPSADGVASDVVSKWGNAINGTDANGNPVGYVWKKEISNEDLAKIKLTGKQASLNPNLDKSFEQVTTSASNGLELVDLRGKAYDDPQWEKLLDQLTPNDYTTLIALSGYGTADLSSINKPLSNDRDSATGLVLTKAMLTMSNVVVLAQTFNEDLSYKWGLLIGDDGLVGGSNGRATNGWYSPAMNIHRNPFSARAGEYYSEDPYLSGIMASKSAIGAAEKGMYTFIKHFAFNEQDLHRGDRGQGGLITWLNEQSARETYLVPFEMCIKAESVTQFYYEVGQDGTLIKTEYKVPAANAVMTAFNRIGYTWTGGNYNLITNILRKEWGFNGFVLTDFDNGGYMDTEQMLYAGADAKLNTLNTCNWSLNTSKADDCYYSREAAHHILYTVVNSSALNGVFHGVTISAGFPYYGFILIGIDLLCVAGVVLLTLSVVKSFKNKVVE